MLWLIISFLAISWNLLSKFFSITFLFRFICIEFSNIQRMKSLSSWSRHSLNWLRIITISLHYCCFRGSCSLMKITMLKSLLISKFFWYIMLSLCIEYKTVVFRHSCSLRSSKECWMLSFLTSLSVIHIVCECLSFIVFPICFRRYSTTP